MEYKDYYKILGVPKTATAKEIKSAFHRLARLYHPDVNKSDPNAESKLKEINEAYDVVGDTEKRKRYDQLGANWGAYEQWQRSGGQGGMPPFDLSDLFGGAARGQRTRPGAGGGDPFGELFGHSDFFRTFFGEGGAGAAAGRSTMPGEDIQRDVEISLEEAYAGTTRLVTLTNPDGTTKRIEIKLPAGVDDGKRVTYSGQGQASRFGGRHGDLVIVVRIAPHPQFTRQGNDLSLRLPVALTTCVLGGEVEVPTLAGPRVLRIPPETADGQRFRLKGLGMPRLRGRADGGAEERGDLFAEVHVELPRNLSRRQRELFDELARLERQDRSSAAD